MKSIATKVFLVLSIVLGVAYGLPPEWMISLITNAAADSYSPPNSLTVGALRPPCAHFSPHRSSHYCESCHAKLFA